ncbi:MAG: M28 family peptidase, partial [Myxococcales bacterium]
MRAFASALALSLLACARAPELAADPALQAIADEVSAERLMQTLQAQVDAHLGDTPMDCSGWDVSYPPDCHHTRTLAGLAMERELTAAGLTVTRHESARAGFLTSNLVAELPGVSAPHEVILVAAHYDAFYGGADDNGSGVAAVVELARVLSRHRFARTIRFVGFDLEELGLVGSTRYVNDQLAVTGAAPIAALIFDCIGFASDARGSQGSLPGFPTPEQGKFIAVMSN